MQPISTKLPHAVPLLEVRLSSFAGPWATLNGLHPLHISEYQLIQVACSLGVPIMFAAVRSSPQAVALGTYKAHAIKSAVDFSQTSLGLPWEYALMDPTEKANISFWTGMTFASMAAQDVLEVCWLWHASTLKKRKHLTVSPGTRTLADLVGLDRHGGWHAIEAKARQGSPSDKDRRNWKRQAVSIASVNGSPVATHSYAFTRVRDPYSVEVIDPPNGADQAGLALEFSRIDMVRSYYHPLVDWLRRSNLTRTLSVGSPGVEVTVSQSGFDPEIGRLVFLGMTASALASVQDDDLPEPTGPVRGEDFYIGRDGIAVLTSAVGDM